MEMAVGRVKNHIARMLPKLGAVDRTQAAVRAVESGCLETEAIGVRQDRVATGGV
jgi:DNA-binding NarL/FixJ family response regulator